MHRLSGLLVFTGLPQYIFQLSQASTSVILCLLCISSVQFCVGGIQLIKHSRSACKLCLRDTVADLDQTIIASSTLQL